MDKKLIKQLSTRVTISFILIKLVLDFILSIIIDKIYISSNTNQGCTYLGCLDGINNFLVPLLVSLFIILIMFSVVTTFISSRITTKINLKNQSINNKEINSIQIQSTSKLIMIYFSIFILIYLVLFIVLRNTIKIPDMFESLFWYEALSFVGTIICFKGFKFKK